MKESRFQAELILKLRDLFPGCVVIKNDPNYMQGVPDLLILFNEKWAMLEVKASKNSPVQPNQQHYIGLLDSMSFADFVYPENEGYILDELQQAFYPRRAARLSKSVERVLD